MLKNMTRAALSAALLIADLSAGLPASAQEYPPGVVIVPVAPPPLRVEAVPPPPPWAAVWEPGHWRWDGHGYRWVRGHYVRRPHEHEHHDWIAGHWEDRPGGHIWVEGFWR